MIVSYRNAVPADAAALDALFDESFTETFGHLYAPEDLALFLSRFSLEDWARELADPDIAFRVGEVGGVLAGYAKLGPVTLPVTPAGAAAELSQLYLRKAWHGAGIAQTLMDWVLETARGRGAEELYLSVFTENHRARRFYARYGFEEVGPYIFMVGNHADQDIILRARL
ncbi:MAG: GNAT family N-acetyltransferase [Sphingomonadaceae bacterium]|nr:GNAT family N-acetyltransferase [Sphingomonadaceae bacterium]